MPRYFIANKFLTVKKPVYTVQYIDTRPIHRRTKRKSFSVRNMFTIKNNYKKTAQKVFTKRECECQGVFIVKRFRTVKNLPVFLFY